MRDLCFNCPYNKGLELGNGCGNDTCIQENMLFEKDEEPVEIEKLNQENLKLIKENQQLKQQLHDLPKKIVEYFYDEIRHRAILEDDYCPDHNLERKYGVRKCLLENIISTVLKKYGGENE